MTLKVELKRIIHKCENLTNWSAVGGTASVDLTTNCYEGIYAVRASNIFLGDYIQYDLGAPIDVSFYDSWGFYYKWGRIEDVYTIRFIDSDGDYKEWTLWKYDNWAKKTGLLSGGSESGTMDWSKLRYIRIRCSLGGTGDPNELHVDFFTFLKDVTSDCLGKTEIITERREYPTAILQARGTWEIEDGDIIRIFDNYTSNSVTTDDSVIFEGVVTDYDYQPIRKIWCESRAKRDLDEFRPDGDYDGKVDSEHLKDLIAECAYLTQGDIDAVAGNTDNTLKGDKTFRNLINSWTDKHYKDWALTPRGKVNYNDDDVDSGEDFDQDDTIWGVEPKKHVDKINITLLLGALVNNVQISATSEDAASIADVGEKLYKDTYSHINIVADLQTAADNLRTREELCPLAIPFWASRPAIGMLQVGETITFTCTYTNPEVTERQVIINKIRYFPVGKYMELQCTDGMYFDKDKAEALPYENSLLIQQNAESIDNIVSDVAYDATSWDANLDAATKNAIRDKIETLGKVAYGQFTGDGTNDWSNTIIGLGFNPYLAICVEDRASDVGVDLILAIKGATGDRAFVDRDNDHHLSTRRLRCIADGFAVCDDGNNASPNEDGMTYNYIAIGR